MNRLSSPISELKPEYEAVVIGSGYGGSIAASRLARLGKKVCLLEKGREFLPGQFPATLGESIKEMQMSKGRKHTGSRNGLYDFVVSEDISVLKGCGLGGTSLINANVSIEPEARVFDDVKWPAAIRNDLGSLQEGMTHARAMLKPTPYPEGKDGYPELAKTRRMRSSATLLQEQFRLADINVNFAEFTDQRNHVGVEQHRCINCGDCVTGCNFTAKNTTTMNYLPDAKNHGAEIVVEVDVSHIERAGDKWLIYFNVLHTGREKFDAPLLFISAERVFLGAGSLGSTEILLRSAQKGLSLSNMLGKKFTGNGDVLGFGYNNDQPVRGIGLGKRAKAGQIDRVGPCITAIVDMRHKPHLEDGMTLEEGSVPGPIGSLLTPTMMTFSRLIGKNTDKGIWDFLREKWRELVSFFVGPYAGAINNTQVYLVMSHDNGNGAMQLEGDQLSITWQDVGKQAIFNKISEKLKASTQAMGGNFVPNPAWTKLLNYDLVSVHPLGGCVMGEDASTGVTDQKGQVFAGTQGVGLHPGLYVLDGAIIPRPLGTNPLLTISGPAERSCKLLAAEEGLTLDYSFPAVPVKLYHPTIGIQFTEKMTGYFSMRELEDYKKGCAQGKDDHSPFTFTLTIQDQDVDHFVEDINHEAGMIGTVLAPALSPEPLSVMQGRFNLFMIDPDQPGRKAMNYAMQLHSKEGKTFYFKGFKTIEDDQGLDIWKDTTNLFITLYDGKDDRAEILGKGMLKIEIDDFLRQMTTTKALHARNKLQGVGAVQKFGKLFAGNIWQTYFKRSQQS